MECMNSFWVNLKA